MNPIDRRRFLATASKAALAAAGAGLFSSAWAAPGKLGVPAGRSGEKIRGFAFEEIDSFITPTEKFFLRSHLEIPRLDPAAFRLDMGGWVERPYRLTLRELASFPKQEMPATQECSGSPVGGGMVSTGEWGGVSLAALLEKARPKKGAVELVMEGADAGLDELVPIPLQYARSVPISVLRDLPGMLVTSMNGAPLRPEHGFPLRAFLPGLYGVGNVKWLVRLTVVKEPFHGFYQTQRYVGLKRLPAGVQMQEILRQRVKSQIARITARPEAGRGATRATGAAWSGGHEIVQVEVSADGGRHWGKAEVAPAKNAYSWVLWSYDFVAPPGSHELVARATDSAGRQQPPDRDPANLTGYVNNWCQRKSFTVPA
ncbi:MAG TPA: sulfite oxidase [Candidatus Polarisedimenticolia bacterium]|nr:sulfite oxidase [Candidatus Polarisedimenticolia bacterium]